MPTVSAVIPSRNRPAFAVRAVRSVLTQTFLDLEVIVVIDGPDPETVAMLQQIDDRRLRVIALKASVGPSEARNIGARNAQGKWVALLDDDDEWLPRKIEKQLAVGESIKAHVPLVVCSFILKTASHTSNAPRRFPRPHEHISEYLFGSPRNGFQTSGFFSSREMFLRIPWRSLRGLQDIDWFLRVTAQPDVELEIVPEPLCIYWTDGESTITSKLDWKSCLDWGRANRSLMTRRAYSSFIAKFCAHRAAKEKAGLRVKVQLLVELLFRGTPSPSALLMFLAYNIFTYETRRDLANWASALRQQFNELTPTN
jgi:glycosyltransferase involved in cell wall biosynthesis